MVLNKATDVISLPDEKGKLYRFVVTCGVKGRAFEIKAPDQRTKSEWMHAIKEVCIYVIYKWIKMQHHSTFYNEITHAINPFRYSIFKFKFVVQT